MRFAGVLVAVLGVAACGGGSTTDAPLGGGGAEAELGGAAGVGAGGSGGAEEGGAPAEIVFTRYPSEATRAPFTASVARRAREIAELSLDRDPNVFMKVGASGTVNTNLLYCFAGPAQPAYDLELGASTRVMPTIEHFRLGDAAGTTPFDRPTIAAEVGKTASWVIDGSPSPLDQEIAALNPRFAFVNYGTNEMQMASTYARALPGFYESLSQVLDQLEGAGIVPIVTGLNPRGDNPEAAHWAHTFDAVTRALAEDRQLPYVSLLRSTEDLPDAGLVSDGIHGNAYLVDGQFQPCLFTEEGLGYSYNVRNQLSIEALHDLRSAVLEGRDTFEAPPLEPVRGSGSADDPFIVDRLPFTHAFSTVGAASEIDVWPCGAQDESGPEIHYRLGASLAGRIRAVVVDREGVDVDIHLVDGAGECARADTIVHADLASGDSVVVDTFVSGGSAQSGAYVLVVSACEPGDPCD